MKDSIKCPNCGFDVDVSGAYRAEVEKEFNQKLIAEKKKFESEVETKRAEYKLHFDALIKKEKDFETNFNNALNNKKIELENELKLKILNENELLLKGLKDELESKSKQINELNLKALEIEKLKREKAEFESALRLQSETELNRRLNEEKERLAKIASEQNELKLKQKDEQMEALRKQLEVAQRKIEQGSEQAQGEAQEVAIEQWLKENFIFDTIEEVKKGTNGADVIQVINTRDAQNCGKIYYESKRTKNFGSDWIEKFKTDMRAGGADVGVIVSEARPKELERMGLIDGVWVCDYSEFKGLCGVLRNGLIELSFAKKMVSNTGEKTQILYNYLVSNEFKMRIEAIVEGFVAMRDELEREKNAVKRIWKSREKQIEKVRDNAIEMFGSIKGIAGNAIGDIKTLELENLANSIEIAIDEEEK